MTRLLIVGGGLAGSIPAKMAAARGLDVTVFDEGHLFGASRSSENLFTMTWKDTLGEDVVNTGLKVLNQNYAIQTINFDNGKGKKNPTFHIPVSEILWRDPVRLRVTAVGNGYVDVVSDDFVTRHYGKVLVAAGAWTGELLKDFKMNALTGHGLVFKGAPAREPVMNFWAPYRHQKLMAWGKHETWFGDSTCIEDHLYMPAAPRVEQSLARAAAFGLQRDDLVTVLYGKRPYFKSSKKGLYRQLASELFVSSSGWKCGLVTYAYQADLLMKDLKL